MKKPSSIKKSLTWPPLKYQSSLLHIMNSQNNKEAVFELPLSLESLLFLSSKPSDILVPDVIFKQLHLDDYTLKLSLKKIIAIILRCHKLSSNRNTYYHEAEKETEEVLMNEISESIGTLDVLRDLYVWEHLNIGHWKSVPSTWRKIYSYISILKVILLLFKGESFTQVIKQCDLGLLMGEPIGDILHCFADEISELIISSKETIDQVPTTYKSYDEIHGQMLPNQCEKSRFNVTYAENPSLEYFSTYMERELPLIITEGIAHWPAKKKWNVEYIKKVAGFRTVPVEIGPKYTSEEWTQKLMTIDEFIEKYMAFNEKRNKKDFGYVAQHHLFDQIKQLKMDIKTPDYCSLGTKSNQIDMNAWFGPANTISPTHFDPKHNLLVQVFGTKIVRLYPPSEDLQPYPANSLLFNTSQLDIEDAYLFKNYPQMRNAKYCEFLLKPGMILYMPPKWWHYIKSLTPSFSVSFWFE